MLEQKTLSKIKNFKKTHSGDVLGVIRTFYPDIKVETVFKQRKRKNEVQD